MKTKNRLIMGGVKPQVTEGDDGHYTIDEKQKQVHLNDAGHEKVESLLSMHQHKTLHLAHISWKNLHHFKRMICFNNLFNDNPGTLNHYNDSGNRLVYQQILKNL